MDQMQLPININEDAKKGRYANNFRLTQTPFEAILDFIFIHPETGGDYVARVVVHPAFLGQISELLNKQLSNKEVSKPDEAVTKQIGFRADQTTDKV